LGANLVDAAFQDRLVSVSKVTSTAGESHGDIEVATIRVFEGVYVGLLPLLQFAVAVAVIAALQFVFYRTALGRAFADVVAGTQRLIDQGFTGPYALAGVTR